MQEKNEKFSIPAAIILAGLVIAVGIIISNTKISLPGSAPNTGSSSKIVLKPVTAADHILGNINASVVIVEFSDTECPFCKMFQTTMQTVISSYSKDQVAWVYRHSPIDSLHPKSRKEAEATECANELGGNDMFWNYIDEVYSTTTSNNSLDPALLPVIAKNVGLDVAKFNSCLSSGKYASYIQSQIDDAAAAGTQGTPYSLLVLKKALTSSQEDGINSFIAQNSGLEQYITISGDKKIVSVGGAMPVQIMKALLDIVLK